jgi:hypothetical protein
MQEIIKLPIKGFEGLYEVHSDGRIFSIRNNIFLKPNNSGTKENPYHFVYLYNESKNRCYIHRLIAKAFIENPLNLATVDHINGDSSDNRVENLRWATQCQQTQNTKKHPGKNKYKGVFFVEYLQKWRVTVRVNGKQLWIGAFKDEVDAAIAYNEAVIKYHGEFARLNDI